MRIIFLITFFLICNLLIAADQKIKIVFRYDDFTLENSTFQDSLLKVFDSNNIPLSIAVIPYDKSTDPKPYQSISSDRLAYLKELIQRNIVEISQHGFNHTKNAPSSEFKGVDEDKQYSLIYNGKRYLDSVLNTNITSFIPPWNSYDSITLAILAKLKFKSISADIYSVATSDNISYIPCTYQYIYDLKNLVDQNKYKDVALIIMLHQYNFYGDNTDYPMKHKATIGELTDVLNWLNENKIKCYSYAQLIGIGEDLGRERYLVNSKPFDGIISHRFEHFYVPVSYKWLKVADKAFWVAYYLILLLVLRTVWYFLKIKLSRKTGIALLVLCIGLLIALLLYGRFTHKFQYIINGLLVFGGWVCFQTFKRKNSET